MRLDKLLVCLSLIATAAVAAPSITGASPNPIDAGGVYFFIDITGAGFLATSTVRWPDGTWLTTVMVDPTHIKAAITPELRALSGTFNITIRDSTGAVSNAFPLYVSPVLFTVTPSVLYAGLGPPMPVTVTGIGFTPTDAVSFNGTQVSTTYHDSKTLTAFIPRDTASDGAIRVVNTAGGDKSGTRPFYVRSLPEITGASPGTVNAGGPYFEMTIVGKAFAPESMVRWAGTPIGTTFVSPTELRVAIMPELRALSGRFELTVGDAATARSNAYAVYLSPVLSAITPVTAPVGSAAVTLTASGVGFIASDAIAWNSQPLPTTYVDSTKLTATIPSEHLRLASRATVQVVDTAAADVSAALPFDVRAIPAVAGVSPNPVDAGGPSFTLTLTGSGFAADSAVYWSGTLLDTTFVSAAELRASIPAASRALSGQFPMTVRDSTGAISSAVPVSVSPVLSAIDPASALAGSAPLLLTATGIGFTRNDVLAWNSTRLATTYVDSTRLTAMVATDALRAGGRATLQVVDQTGADTSAPLTFTITAAPAIAGLAPAGATSGTAALTVTVLGSDFVSGAIVKWNGTALPTTFFSATQLRAEIAANLLVTAGTFVITVVNLSGLASGPSMFTVSLPPPAVATLSPASAVAGSPEFTLAVSGANFTPGASVVWNGARLATTLVSASRLTVQVTAGQIAAAGSVTVAVVNAAGATSNVAAFAILPPRPVIQALNPGTIPADGSALTLWVDGSVFFAGAAVRWNGTPLETTFVSPTLLTAFIPAELTASAARIAITVANPNGLLSDAAALTLTSAPLAAILLAPNSAVAGVGNLTVTMHGVGFSPGAVVSCNGAALPTSFVSGVQLTTTVPAELTATAGAYALTVHNPDGSASGILIFTISARPPAAPAIAAVVNAASGSTSIAPGSLISIFGTNLAAAGEPASDMPLPAALNGTSVTIDGRTAPLSFVSPTQINAQLPFETVLGKAVAVVQTAAGQSTPATFTVTATGPGILTTGMNDHALAVNYADGSLNSAEHPAGPGQYITIYLTGQGAVSPLVETGAAAPADPFAIPAAPVTVKIGGKLATVPFAGLAPGFAGLLQINLEIPQVEGGEQRLDIAIGGVAANPAVLSIRP